jgi:hypothetical protein
MMRTDVIGAPGSFLRGFYGDAASVVAEEYFRQQAV